MIEKYLSFCKFFCKLCGIFAVLCMILSILIITELVLERYLFQSAITWQTELVTMLLVASTFIGSAYVLSINGHVNVEYIYGFLKTKNKLKLQIITSSMSLLFFIFLFYLGFEITKTDYLKNYTTGTIWDPPLWIPYSSMFIGSLLMVLQYFAQIIKLIQDLKEN